MSLDIIGIGLVPSNVAEYTTGEVQKKYLEYMALLQQILDKRPDNSDPNSRSVTPADFDTLMTTMNNLKTLALNGAQDPNSGATFYLTNEMANNLNLVFQSLNAVGINFSSSVTDNATKVSLLQNWQSLSTFKVEDILSQANGIKNSTNTLQSLVELDYVKQGNDILSSQLSGLQDQLQTTQGILKTLTIVQNISNQISVANRGAFAFPPNNDNDIPSTAISQLQNLINQLKSSGVKLSDDLTSQINNFSTNYANDVKKAKSAAATNKTSLSTELSKLNSASNVIVNINNTSLTATSGGKSSTTSNYSTQYFEGMYRVMASAHFSQIIPLATPSSTAATDLLAAKQQLIQELSDLENQNPTATRSTAGSLASFVYQVALDISNQFKNIGNNLTSAQLKSARTTAVKSWIMDNQDQVISTVASSNTGSIQNNIAQAINASQSLNDQQKELVQNYMFIFQQFYQSASAVLQKIVDTINRMAQGITGN